MQSLGVLNCFLSIHKLHLKGPMQLVCSFCFNVLQELHLFVWQTYCCGVTMSSEQFKEVYKKLDFTFQPKCLSLIAWMHWALNLGNSSIIRRLRQDPKQLQSFFTTWPASICKLWKVFHNKRLISHGTSLGHQGGRRFSFFGTPIWQTWFLLISGIIMARLWFFRISRKNLNQKIFITVYYETIET